MKNKIVALFASIVMLSGLAVAMAPAASAAAPKSDCSYAITPPDRVNARDSGTRMYAMARAKRPIINGRSTSVKLWIDIWRPGVNKFQRYSMMDYDSSNQVAVAVVENNIPLGYNYWRSGAEFTCNVGSKTYVTRRFSSVIRLHRDIRPYYGLDLRYGGYPTGKERLSSEKFGGWGGGGGWGAGTTDTSSGFGGYGGGGGWSAG